MTDATQWQNVSALFPECTLALQSGSRLLVITDRDTFGDLQADLLAVYQLDADGLPDETKPALYLGENWKAACTVMEG